LAAVLPSRPLDLVGRGLVLVLGLFLGLGAVPLRTLVLLSASGLALGARHVLGSVVGHVAV
jgi:hypothetical protein